MFDDEVHTRMRALWESVRIVRSVEYTLFTFGESVLPYYLVCSPAGAERQVSISHGEVRITRPLILRPDSDAPEFRNFFEEDSESEGMVRFLLSREAAFRNLRFDNQQLGGKQIVSDSVEEAVDRLNRQLDAQDEDRVAILTAPEPFAGLAVVKYAADRVMQSAPGNIQELRERGFLP